MKQKDKDLLLKDLCTRLPYYLKVRVNEKIETLDVIADDCGYYFNFLNDNEEGVTIENIKPYLFPLSSMTEEQYESLKESGILSNCNHIYEYVNPHIYGISFIFKKFKTYSLELIEWLNKNHFDYRGLIEKGLAIDATGLNIY